MKNLHPRPTHIVVAVVLGAMGAYGVRANNTKRARAVAKYRLQQIDPNAVVQRATPIQGKI